MKKKETQTRKFKFAFSDGKIANMTAVEITGREGIMTKVKEFINMDEWKLTFDRHPLIDIDTAWGTESYAVYLTKENNYRRLIGYTNYRVWRNG